MNSEQLANHVYDMSIEALADAPSYDQIKIIEQAQSRIMGVGHEQYSEGDKQKFELVPIDTLLEWAEDETVDQINYGVMALVRIREEIDTYELAGASLEMDCYDLIESGIIQTQAIRGMREKLARALAN